MKISMQSILLIILSILLIPLNSFAQIHTVISDGEYVMGDNDTKIEARKIALEHAKRQALEQIGTYLESETIVKNNQLTKDEIKIYTSGIIKTTVIEENVDLLKDKTTVLRLRINATVDTALLNEKIREIEADKKRKKQIEELQKENIKLLKEIESISTQLKNDKSPTYINLRQQREQSLEKLEKNQKSIKLALEKGTLLNLAIKNKNEVDDLKSYIDDTLNFIANNTVYTIGEPKIRYKGDYADLLIDVSWRIDKINDLLEKLSFIYNKPGFGYPSKNDIILFSHPEDHDKNYGFKGVNAEALNEYLCKKSVGFEVKASKWQLFHSIAGTFGREGVYRIKTIGNEALILKDISLENLKNITNIDVKVVVYNQPSLMERFSPKGTIRYHF